MVFIYLENLIQISLEKETDSFTGLIACQAPVLLTCLLYNADADMGRIRKIGSAHL